jgi:hypothetical protein
MEKRDMISRRVALKAAGAGLGLAAAVVDRQVHARSPERDNSPFPAFRNEDFYDADGSFSVEKTKKGILRVCEYYRYPVFPGFEEGLWVSDYGAGQFAKMGLAAYIFVNSVEDRYMMLDMFLLPGQMLPEHWHVEGEGNPAKLEGWLVRWGISHIVGIGEPNLSKDVVIPECHWGGKVTTRHEVIGTPGTFVPLAKVGTRHWQYGGPQGAIVTEVATVHTSSAVRHSDPALNEYFLNSL